MENSAKVNSKTSPERKPVLGPGARIVAEELGALIDELDYKLHPKDGERVQGSS